ncbi:MAG: phytanoyl-CoA dioxygenase family protein [Pseudomonadota bacterium]
MSTEPDADPRAAGATDPFSADAQRINQQRLITTEDERAAVASESAALRDHGFVLLPDAVDEAALAAPCAALDEINANTRHGIYAFEGTHTHRAYCVVSQSRAFDELVMHRRVLAVIESYFGEAPQLSASMGMTLYEGQTAQPLHRDTGHFNLPWPRPPLEVNAIWAFDDFRESNGATRFVPGSHTIPNEVRPTAAPTVAEMTAGSVFLYDGALWHGGGAATEPGARRRSVNNIYIRQWLRQQDNMYLSFSREQVLAMPRLMQRLLGYWVYGFTLGVVNGEAPLSVLGGAQSNR